MQFYSGFSQDESRRAIKNVIKAVEPGGKLYIVGRVLDDDHLSPASALNSNLFFLNIYDGGQAHTERQHLEWLTDAGCESIKRDVMSDGRSVIVSRRPF